MKIMFVSAEVAPFSKVGGLADVVGSLPKILEKMGHEVAIFTPLHGCIDQQKYNIQDRRCLIFVYFDLEPNFLAPDLTSKRTLMPSGN